VRGSDLVRERQCRPLDELGDEDADCEVVGLAMPREVRPEGAQHAALFGGVKAKLFMRLTQRRRKQILVGLLMTTTRKPDVTRPSVAWIDPAPDKQNVLVVQTDKHRS